MPDINISLHVPQLVACIIYFAQPNLYTHKIIRCRKLVYGDWEQWGIWIQEKDRETLTWLLEKSAPLCPDLFFGSHIWMNLSLISAGVRCSRLCSPQELYNPAACAHSVADTCLVPTTVSKTRGAVCYRSNIHRQHHEF